MVKPHHIPSKAFVPRKPQPIGGEHKCTADGECGAIMRIEYMEGEDAHAAQEYYEDWGYTSALNLRLSKPYRRDNPIYLGDAHFIGVDELECLLLNVRTPAPAMMT